MDKRRRIKPLSRISTEAWRFDQPEAERKKRGEKRWSFEVFGPSWSDAQVLGTVLRSLGRSWVIHWDLDAEGNASSDVDLDGNDSGGFRRSI